MSMRCVLAAAAGLILSAAGPAALAQGLEFGAKAGPNFSTVNVNQEPTDIYSRRVGIAGGGFAVIPVAGRVSLQIELLQMPKGAKFKAGDVGTPGGSRSNKLLLDYLDIPVLARVTAPGPAGFHVFGGPYISFRRRAKLEYAQTVSSMTAGSRQDVSGNVKRTEAGVAAGAGVHLGRHGVLDARYIWGLTNVNRDATDGLRIRHRIANFMIGVRF
jgi:hypothetical protein